MNGELVENRFDINFRSAGNAYTQIRVVQAHKVLQNDQDFFSCGWHTRVVRTLVERVHDDVNRVFGYDSDHLL